MFGLEDMKKIVYGGLVREKETGAFTFSRMTVKQYGYFTREEDARFLVRMGCTAGICMDFYTDSGSLEFDYEISGMSDRDIVQLDICQNGVRTGGPAQKPGKDTVGSIHHRIDRGRPPLEPHYSMASLYEQHSFKKYKPCARRFPMHAGGGDA